MSGEFKCEHCDKSFRDINAVRQHTAKKHKGRRNKWTKIMRENKEPSYGDMLVEAQINAACGEPVDEVIEMMFPDEIAEERRCYNENT